jgi:hypothetical protein
MFVRRVDLEPRASARTACDRLAFRNLGRGVF